MAGTRQKAPELLTNRRAGRGRGLVTVSSAGERRQPSAPPGLRAHARGVWRRYWASPVSLAVDFDADYEALRHWILAVDEREKLSELTLAQPLIPGSRHTRETPHFMLNPLFRRISELTDDIRRGQEAFGMTPLSRWRLQLTYAEAGKSLADLRGRTASGRSDAGGGPKILDLDALG